MSLPPALAAEEDQSEALGRVINADILSLDLADVGTSQSGFPSDAGPNSDPLNLELLSALNLDVGTVSLPLIGTETEGGLLHLGEVGAVSSYAASEDGQSSVASAGAVGDDGALDLDGIAGDTYGSAKVDLTDLLGQVGVDGLTDQIVDEVSLQLGALGSTATAAGGEVTSEYVVADGQLVISSPLVGGVSTELDTALTGVGTVLNDAVGTEGLLGSVASAVDINLSIPAVATIEAGGGTIGLTGLDAALEEASNTVINEPLVDSNGLVSIDLANGVISVDLQQLGGPEGLNGLPANTELLDSDTIALITGAVTEALGTVTTKAGDALDDVLGNVGLTVEIPAKVSAVLGVVTANVDIVVDTTLGQLAGTSPGEPTIEISGNLLGIPLDPVLDAVLEPLVGQLINPLGDLVDGLLTTATSGLTETLDALIQPILDTLSPVLSGVLTEIVSVTINEQLEPGYLGDASFTVNALSLQLLPNLGSGAAKIDLASSTVRASDVAAEDPTLTATPPTVEDGGTTTVTGENYPPNTDVTVQLIDPAGNPVGDPIAVTTDEDGSFTTDVLVPEGSEAGDYTVDGTADTGETATTDLGVTNADDPTNDNTAENTEINTEVNTGDNTDVNTDVNTEVNTGDNTDVNTDVNTGDNTEVNTEANTGENTEVNTGENTDVNTEVNTGDNTDVNTEANTGENTEVNTGDNTDVNTEANTGDNTDVNTEANTGENTDVNTEVNTGENTDVNTGDNTDVNTEANTGENTEVNTGDNTDVNTEANTGDNTDVNTEANTGENTDVNTEVNTGENTDVNTGDNTDVNTEANTGENTEVNTGDNTDVNTEANTGENTEVNTEANTGENTEVNAEANTGENTDVNTEVNTGDNTDVNTGDNTADNTARAEIDLTPNRCDRGR